MLETQIANVAWTFIAAVMLWTVYRYLVVRMLRDFLRQRLFGIRREMFLYMVDGGIEPTNPAYSRVRSFMNAAIRFADGLSLTRSFIGAKAAGEYGKERTRELEAAIASLPEESRERIAHFRMRASVAVGFYMIAKSPVGWVIIICAITLALLSAAASSHRIAWAKTWAEAVQTAKYRAARRAEQETENLRCIEDEQYDPGAATVAA